MNSPENHHDLPLHHDESDDSPEAFMQRMRALYETQRTSLDELVELARTEPGGERFEVLLDDIAYEALSENEEFIENAKAMRSGRLSQDEQVRIRDRQRELLATYKEAIIREAGLPSEAALSEIEKSKEVVKEKIETYLATHDKNEPLEVLEMLGILEQDEDGRQKFTYPEGLFPESTDEKWLTYLETVRSHLRIERAVHAGTMDKSELGNADTARRMAHNAVTRDVDEILGLNKLPDSTWDFANTRNLLAKMRDSRFPTVETAEKFVTEKSILTAQIGEHAVRSLIKRLSDLHK